MEKLGDWVGVDRLRDWVEVDRLRDWVGIFVVRFHLQKIIKIFLIFQATVTHPCLRIGYGNPSLRIGQQATVTQGQG
jgi:hypothetical protein